MVWNSMREYKMVKNGKGWLGDDMKWFDMVWDGMVMGWLRDGVI